MRTFCSALAVFCLSFTVACGPSRSRDIDPALVDSYVRDLPPDLGDLMADAFVNLSADREYRVAVTHAVLEHVKAMEGTSQAIRPITGEELSTAGYTDDGELIRFQNQIAYVAVGELEASVRDLTAVLSSPDLETVSEGLMDLEVCSDTDRACFIDGSCEHYLVFDATRVNDTGGLMGRATQEFSSTWIHAGDDEIPAVFLRQAVPEKTDFSAWFPVLSVHQQYQLTMLVEPEPGRTLRIDAMYGDVELLGFGIDTESGLERVEEGLATFGAELVAAADDGFGWEIGGADACE